MKQFNSTESLCSSLDAGAEGMQEAGNVCVFYGSDTWRLHYQPRVQLGGPSGPECLPTARQPGGKPEAGAWHGGEDSKNDLCLCVVVVREKKGPIVEDVMQSYNSKLLKY